jgi:hypothetical protein
MASEHPDEAPERLSSDESLWGDQEPRRKRGGSAFGVRLDELPKEAPSGTFSRPPRPSEVPEPRPRRRLLRVDLLIAVAALGLLLVGFLLGAAVTHAGTPASRPAPQASAPPVPAAPSTSIVVRPAPPPRACLVAMERADAAISYLVGHIRDQRLSDTIQQFVESRRACQAAVR